MSINLIAYKISIIYGDYLFERKGDSKNHKTKDFNEDKSDERELLDEIIIIPFSISSAMKTPPTGNSKLL